jgi:four helix bundle protein
LTSKGSKDLVRAVLVTMSSWRGGSRILRLASEVRDLATAISSAGGLRTDWKLRDQLRSAASSTTANIAEGFGRFRPREFARSLRYANGSVLEVRAHAIDAHARGHIDADTLERLSFLCFRTSIAIARLIRYLDGCDPEFRPSDRKS